MIQPSIFNPLFNYCTGFFDGLGTANWGICCYQHDVAYEMLIPKLQADWELYQCVKDQAGWPIAILMFIGVSTLGIIFYAYSVYVNRRRK